MVHAHGLLIIWSKVLNRKNLHHVLIAVCDQDRNFPKMIHCCLFNVKISIFTSWNTCSVSVSILYQHTYSIFVLKQRYRVAYIGARKKSMKLKLLARKSKIIAFATKGTKLNITKRWALELVSYRLAGDLSTSSTARRLATHTRKASCINDPQISAAK